MRGLGDQCHALATRMTQNCESAAAGCEISQPTQGRDKQTSSKRNRQQLSTALGAQHGLTRNPTPDYLETY